MPATAEILGTGDSIGGMATITPQMAMMKKLNGPRVMVDVPTTPKGGSQSGTVEVTTGMARVPVNNAVNTMPTNDRTGGKGSSGSSGKGKAKMANADKASKPGGVGERSGVVEDKRNPTNLELFSPVDAALGRLNDIAELSMLEVLDSDLLDSYIITQGGDLSFIVSCYVQRSICLCFFRI